LRPRPAYFSHPPNPKLSKSVSPIPVRRAVSMQRSEIKTACCPVGALCGAAIRVAADIRVVNRARRPQNQPGFRILSRVSDRDRTGDLRDHNPAL
jgi:hypothetical protein